MGRIAFSVIATIATVTVVRAQSLVGSAHDLSNKSVSDQACMYCHTPNQASTADGRVPLWNRTLSSDTNYGTYRSDTMHATPSELAGADPGSAFMSELCMSCHDGTVAVDTARSDFPVGGALGSSLTDDHPVNFLYDAALAAADGELVIPDSLSSVDTAGRLRLFGGTLQCVTAL